LEREWHSYFYLSKILGYNCTYREEGVDPVRTFFGKAGEGINSSGICVDVFYERPLVHCAVCLREKLIPSEQALLSSYKNILDL